MSPRVVRPLPEKHPDVAATWDVEANGERCPPDLHPGSSRSVFWCCPRGHRWRESIARRVKMEPWKSGDRAACRACVGGWVVTRFACGHTVAVPASKARPHYRMCPDCWAEKRERDEADYQAALIERRARRKELAPECKAEAAVDAARLWSEHGLERLPGLLQKVARQQLVAGLTETLIVQRVGGRTRPDVHSLVDELAALANGGLGGVAHGGGPMVLLGQPFWAPSLTTEVAPRHEPEADVIASLVAVAGSAARLEDEIGEWVARDWMIEIAYNDDPNAPIPASWVTSHITDQLKEWARARGWRGYRELRVPLHDERAFGRLDLVVFRPGLPDLVIEIDSQNVDRSVAKLELARDRGALAVWLRWQQGRVPELDGVEVLDLVHTTASV